MRKASIVRKTRETDINLEFDLDGGDYSIDTNCGFLNHMLELFACSAHILGSKLFIPLASLGTLDTVLLNVCKCCFVRNARMHYCLLINGSISV